MYILTVCVSRTEYMCWSMAATSAVDGATGVVATSVAVFAITTGFDIPANPVVSARTRCSISANFEDFFVFFFLRILEADLPEGIMVLLSELQGNDNRSCRMIILNCSVIAAISLQCDCAVQRQGHESVLQRLSTKDGFHTPSPSQSDAQRGVHPLQSSRSCRHSRRAPRRTVKL